MFKYKHNYDMIPHDRPGTRLQIRPTFEIERPDNVKYIHSILYLFRNEWNELPPHIRPLNEQKGFNLVVKRYFMEHYQITSPN